MRVLAHEPEEKPSNCWVPSRKPPKRFIPALPTGYRQVTPSVPQPNALNPTSLQAYKPNRTPFFKSFSQRTSFRGSLLQVVLGRDHHRALVAGVLEGPGGRGRRLLPGGNSGLGSAAKGAGPAKKKPRPVGQTPKFPTKFWEERGTGTMPEICRRTSENPKVASDLVASSPKNQTAREPSRNSDILHSDAQWPGQQTGTLFVVA